MNYKFWRVIVLFLNLVQVFYGFDVTASQTEREEFHIVGVGQGNFQLAVYEDSGFAVIYDCGAKYSHMPKKIKSRFWEDSHPIFVRNKEVLQNLIIPEDIFDDTPPSIKGKAQSREYTGHKDDIDQLQYNPDEVNGIINRYRDKLSVLFLFLSHSDEDHINLVSSINSDLPLIAFLGGDWLGEAGANTARDNLSDPVKCVLHFLFNRANTHVELPYYWNYRGTKPYHPVSYATLQNFLWENQGGYHVLHSRTTYDLFKEKAYPNNSVFRWKGNLEELLQKSNALRPGVIDNFIQTTNAFRLMKNDLQNVFIWSMNNKSKDANDQSSIVSFTMPKLGMNFVCTGDATSTTFASINKEDILNRLPQFNHSDFLNLLVLPHHGAGTDWSPEMFDLFSPHILAVSASNGRYGHPDRKVIEAYKEQAKERGTHKAFISNFKYDQSSNLMIYFEKQIDDTYKPYLHKYKEDQLPVLSTNVLGTITIDAGGISCIFKNYIEANLIPYSYAPQKYRINFERAAQTIKTWEASSLLKWSATQDLGIVHFLDNRDQHYYVLEDGFDVKLYALEEI